MFLCLPKPPPAWGEEPSGGGVKETVGEHGGSGQQEADGLVAMEEAALGFAAGGALLLNSVAFQFVLHAGVLSL